LGGSVPATPQARWPRLQPIEEVDAALPGSTEPRAGRAEVGGDVGNLELRPPPARHAPHNHLVALRALRLESVKVHAARQPCITRIVELG
jgi:hypothetical protein